MSQASKAKVLTSLPISQEDALSTLNSFLFKQENPILNSLMDNKDMRIYGEIDEDEAQEVNLSKRFQQLESFYEDLRNELQSTFANGDEEEINIIPEKNISARDVKSLDSSRKVEDEYKSESAVAETVSSSFSPSQLKNERRTREGKKAKKKRKKKDDTPKKTKRSKRDETGDVETELNRPIAVKVERDL